MPNTTVYIDNKTNMKALRILTDNTGIGLNTAMELIERLDRDGLMFCEPAQRVTRTATDAKEPNDFSASA